MGGRPAEDLLRLAVRLHGIQLGRPTDLILDLGTDRILGFDVLCGDDVHRFLPLAAARIGDTEITVDSALTLLDESELAFYRERACALSDLRGLEVVYAGHPGGRLRDVLVGENGTLRAVLAEHEGELRRLDAAAGLQVQAESAA